MDREMKSAKAIARWNGRMIIVAGVACSFLMVFREGDFFVFRALLAMVLLAIMVGSGSWMVWWGKQQ